MKLLHRSSTTDQNCLYFMTHGISLVMLPGDLYLIVSQFSNKELLELGVTI